MLLGCIADDTTGATDLANNLVRSGLRVVQTIGVPGAPLDADVDAVVVALKSRTIEPDAAVALSLAALRWLQAEGAAQIYFKVCSTFDSTDRGNIGPVAEALMDALGTTFTIACPAFPANQRTVFNGHLFVGELLLSDSSMRHHPLTPMTDANLVRVLQRQCRRRVGLIDHRALHAGVDAVRARSAELRRDGIGLAIVDATSDDDLMVMGRAFADLPLLVAGSGVAIGLAQNHGIVPSAEAARLPPPQGARAVVSGSCSAASNAQVRHHLEHGGVGHAVDPLALAAGVDVVAQALAWADAQPSAAARAGELVEQALSAIARGLVERGVGQLIVAGGETSGACVQALQIAQLRIGPQIDPGVPWCHAVSPVAPRGLHIALKSGNFGGVDFFSRAFGALA